MHEMTRVIAFDVNETLLDLRALDAPFTELLGRADLPWGVHDDLLDAIEYWSTHDYPARGDA